MVDPMIKGKYERRLVPLIHWFGFLKKSLMAIVLVLNFSPIWLITFIQFIAYSIENKKG